MADASISHIEIKKVEGVDTPVGKDPRAMSVSDLNELGHHKVNLRKLIRKHCVSCCGGMQSEVRHCTIIACEFWPYRMNKNPFNESKGNAGAIGQSSTMSGAL